MSSIVLLDREGVVVRKFQFVSLPDNFVVPEGMTVSWRMNLRVSSTAPLASLYGPPEPPEANFYLGDAWAQVSRDGFRKFEQETLCGPTYYGGRNLTITVQGPSAKDVMRLRDCIMHLINSGARWGASNDLNPKPRIGFLSRIRKMVGMAK